MPTVSCPKCQFKLPIQGSMVGQRLICPECQTPFLPIARPSLTTPASGPWLAQPQAPDHSGPFRSTPVTEIKLSANPTSMAKVPNPEYAQQPALTATGEERPNFAPDPSTIPTVTARYRGSRGSAASWLWLTLALLGLVLPVAAAGAFVAFYRLGD